MAFTGTATIKQLSGNLIRITGLSLGSGANGTIGLHGNSGSPGVRLPASFDPQPYSLPSGDVSLQDAVDCRVGFAATGVATALTFAVVKTGTDASDFLITVTNNQATASGALEFYIRNHQ